MTSDHDRIEHARTYTEWLTEKVAASRNDLSDGSNQVYTEDEWKKIRADKVADRNNVPD